MKNRVLRYISLPCGYFDLSHATKSRVIKRSQIAFCRSRIALFVNSSVYDPIAKLGDTIAIIFTIIIFTITPRDNSRVTKDSFKNAYSRVKPYVILMNSNATLVFPFATVVSMFPRDGCLCSRDAMPAHMPMFLRCLCSFDVYVHAMSMFFFNYIRVMRLSSSALLWIIFRRELDWWGVLLRNDRRNDKIDWNNRTRL